MPSLFPIGAVANDSSKGTLDAYSFDLFEPNNGVHSIVTYGNLVTGFENQTMQTRKKNSPTITITYNYDNIWSREFRQIERFVQSVEGNLTSFLVVDWSKGRKPYEIANSAGLWTITIYGRREFSATVNYKADNAIVWDGVNWKLGDIINHPVHQINLDTGTVASYGGLLRSNAVANKALVYPVYQVYLSPDSMSSFKTTGYVKEDNESVTSNLNVGDGGYTYSGVISFLSKFKVR